VPTLLSQGVDDMSADSSLLTRQHRCSQLKIMALSFSEYPVRAPVFVPGFYLIPLCFTWITAAVPCRSRPGGGKPRCLQRFLGWFGSPFDLRESIHGPSNRPHSAGYC
jgi:hypothetical protein